MWSMNRWEKHVVYMANQPNTLQKEGKFLAGERR